MARTALEVGASLLVNTYSHSPSDLISWRQAERVARGAGLREPAVQTFFTAAAALSRRLAEL